MTTLSPLVLYCLKRDYPASIDIYQLSTSTVDLSTGAKTVTTAKFHIARAVALPERMLRSKIIMRTANHEFLNLADFGTREFIVDRKDAKGLVPSTDDWIVHGTKKYQVASIETFECGGGWILTGKEMAGDFPLQELNPLRAVSNLDVRTEAAG